MIKRIVTRVQRFFGYRTNRFHRSRNIDVDGVFLVHCFNQSKIHTPVRIIGIHINLLCNNAFFLVHILVRKIRILHKVD
ncbi:hypothetical protein D3C76_1220900 [compost metagenome]